MASYKNKYITFLKQPYGIYDTPRNLLIQASFSDISFSSSTIPPITDGTLLTEDGFNLLNQDGGTILLQ